MLIHSTTDLAQFYRDQRKQHHLSQAAIAQEVVIPSIIEEPIPSNAAEDSYNMLPALLNTPLNHPIREATVHHSIDGVFAIRQGKWKLIFGPGSGGWSAPKQKQARSQKLPLYQLYDLEIDFSEKNNVASQYPDIVQNLTLLMQQYVENGRSTAGSPQKNDTKTTFLPTPYKN